MKRKIFATFIAGIFMFGGQALANPVPSSLPNYIGTQASFITTDGDEFKKVTIRRIIPDGIVIAFDDGITKLPFKKLSQSDQIKYGYDPTQEASFLEKQSAIFQRKIDNIADQNAKLTSLIERQAAHEKQVAEKAANDKRMSNEAKVKITVSSPDGKAVAGAEAALILRSGAYEKGKLIGSEIVFNPFNGTAKLFIAAPGFESYSHSYSPTDKPNFVLKPSENRDSIIIFGSGNLPGKGGTINPIFDNLDRTYIYGTGIGLFEGGWPANPLTFRLKFPIAAIDSTGKHFKIYVMDISRAVSLVEYTK